MKKSGFTIVELIVSIALITMLSTILTVVIVKKIKAVKDTTYNLLIESIGVSAEEYATNNEALLASYAENDWVKIPISTLIEKNYFDETLTNPKTKKDVPITDYVYITRNYKGKVESFYNINQNSTPNITLNGKYNIFIKLNSVFNDPGVVAFDSDGTNVTSLVTKTGTVDPNQNGVYVITYKYKTSIITRNVIVGDNKEDGAVWYTLTINPSGGYFNGSNETTIYNLKEGRNQDLSDIIKTGNDFDRWELTCTGCSVTNGIFTMGTSNATVVAVWIQLPMLTVNLNGGSTSQIFTTYYHNGDQIELINPTKNGSTFKFWTFVGDGASLNGNIFTIGSGGATLNANWLAYGDMYTYTGSSSLENDGGGNWRIKLLSSGSYIFTPLVDMSIDAFLVGGGGAGGRSADNGLKCGGGGGAGGYTGTYTLNLTANVQYTITIGSGGIHSTANSGYGGTGGTTAAFGYSVSGGTGGYGYIGSTGPHAGGTGGSNGGAGITGNGYAGNSYGSATQGSTTCEFGEGNTTSCTNGNSYAYAGGGGGGGGNGGSGGTAGIAGAGAGAGVGGCTGGYGTSNTGGGGGGAYSKGVCYGGDGGSGIVIIRNHR